MSNVPCTDPWSPTSTPLGDAASGRPPAARLAAHAASNPAAGDHGSRGRPPSRRRAALPPCLPQQQAAGPHDGDGMPRQARPHPPLGPVSAPRPRGRLVTRLDGVATMGNVHYRLQGRRGRQGAPRVVAFFGLPTSGSLAHQPAHASLPRRGQAPPPQRHARFAPPARGALPSAHGAPLAAGPRNQDLLGLRPRPSPASFFR
jgi:hypothetical protein